MDLEKVLKIGDYGILAIVLLLVLIGIGSVVKRCLDVLLPSIQGWFDSHADLAKVCSKELPKIREVGQNSTEAIKHCTSAVQKCTELVETTAKNTALVGREHRDARDAATHRDGQILTRLDKLQETVEKKLS